MCRCLPDPQTREMCMKLRQKDAAVLLHLYEYIPRIKFILRSEFGSVLAQVDMLDLIHEGIIRTFDRGERYNPELASIYTFLMANVRFAIKDFLRKTHIDYHNYMQVHTDTTITHCDHKDEPSPRIIRVLSQLPTQQRDIVVKRYYHDIPVVDIAKELAIKEETVRQQLSRAYRTLFVLLGKDPTE